MPCQYTFPQAGRQPSNRLAAAGRMAAWMAMTGPTSTDHPYLHGLHGSPLWVEGVHPPR